MFIGIGDNPRGATNAALLSFFKQKKVVESISTIDEVQNMFNMIIASYPNPPKNFCIGDWYIDFYDYGKKL